MSRWASCVALLISLGAATADGEDGGISAGATDGGTAGGKVELKLDAGPCAAERRRVERRKAWLAERYEEQSRRGFPDPKTGIPNMIALFCEAHPDHEECTLGNPPIEFSPDELTYEAQKTFEDRDPHVIALKRALHACRQRIR